MDLDIANDAYVHLKDVAVKVVEYLSLGKLAFMRCERLLMRGGGLGYVLRHLEHGPEFVYDVTEALSPVATPESISHAQATLRRYCHGNTDILRFLPEDKEDLSNSLAILGLLLSYSKDTSKSLDSAEGYIRAISWARAEGFVPVVKWRNAEALARGSSMSEVATDEGVSAATVRYRVSGLYPFVTLRKVKDACRIVQRSRSGIDRTAKAGLEDDAESSDYKEKNREELWDLANKERESPLDRNAAEFDLHSIARGDTYESSQESEGAKEDAETDDAQQMKPDDLVIRDGRGKTYTDEDCWAAVVEYLSLKYRTHTGSDFENYASSIEGMPALMTVKTRLRKGWADIMATGLRVLAGDISPSEEEWAQDILTPRDWPSLVRNTKGNYASKRYAIGSVKECMEECGSYITHHIYNDWARKHGKRLSHTLIHLADMSWNRLVKEAGGYSGRRKVGLWTDEEILKVIALYLKQERSKDAEPTIEGYSAWCREQDMPLPNIVLVSNRFGTWVRAVNRAQRLLRVEEGYPSL